MARIAIGVAAFLSFVSLVLVAISMATNYWVRFDNEMTEKDEKTIPSPLNPLVTNTQFTALAVQYNVKYFGLWVGCHKEQTLSMSAISCGYVGSQCYSNICWIRNGEEKKCLDARVTAIAKCAAYQATRAMTIIGTLLLIVGASILVVSVCITSRLLTLFGSVMTFLGGIFLMISFAVFFENISRPLDEIAGIGWSFVLLIVSWPLAVIAGLIGLIVNVGSSKDDEQGELDESD